jgi:hypothetical protein
MATHLKHLAGYDPTSEQMQESGELCLKQLSVVVNTGSLQCLFDVADIHCNSPVVSYCFLYALKLVLCCTNTAGTMKVGSRALS